jgi:hypothetical protein
MIYVRHIKGGSVSFVRDGQIVTMNVGSEGDVPDAVYRRYATRFERIAPPPLAIRSAPHHMPAPIDHATTQMRQSQTRFVARHRGRGKWVVWDDIANEIASDADDREHAESLAAAYNAANQ